MDIKKKIIRSLLKRSSFQNYQNDLEAVKEKLDNHLIILCAPKSGSTWLSRIMKNILKYDEIQMVSTFGHREQEIDFYYFLTQQPKGSVFSPHLHLKYSEYSESFFRKIDTKIIFQVRDIYDSVISLLDHVDKEGTAFPSAYISKSNWENMNRNEKIEFIVDLAIPWYISFYAGWYKSSLFNSDNFHLLTYESLLNDTNGEVSKIIDRFSLNIEKSDVELSINSVSKNNTRKNVGIVGRGQDINQNTRNKINRMASYHKDVDFTPLGIKL